MTPGELTAATRRRLEAQAERARANAAYEADQCVRLTHGLNLTGYGVGVPLAKAERLATSATALVRYLSTLEAYETAMAMLGDA